MLDLDYRFACLFKKFSVLIPIDSMSNIQSYPSYVFKRHFAQQNTTWIDPSSLNPEVPVFSLTLRFVTHKTITEQIPFFPFFECPNDNVSDYGFLARVCIRLISGKEIATDICSELSDSIRCADSTHPQSLGTLA